MVVFWWWNKRSGVLQGKAWGHRHCFGQLCLSWELYSPREKGKGWERHK